MSTLQSLHCPSELSSTESSRGRLRLRDSDKRLAERPHKSRDVTYQEQSFQKLNFQAPGPPSPEGPTGPVRHSEATRSQSGIPTTSIAPRACWRTDE